MPKTAKPEYRTVLLKLSGEVLSGKQGYGIDPSVLEGVAQEVKKAVRQGIRIGIVTGAGNIFRGDLSRQKGSRKIERVTGDSMGMLGTLINSLAIRDIFRQCKMKCEVLSAFAVPGMVDRFERNRALDILEKGSVLVIGGGTGNPFFTTDSAAALRAVEIGADVLLKATRVDGVYDRDPEKDPKAAFYKKISYAEILEKKLKVMDAAAVSLCQENKMRIIVYNFFRSGEFGRILLGGRVRGTVIQ